MKTSFLRKGDDQRWREVIRDLVAKTLEELHYEEVLEVKKVDEGLFSFRPNDCYEYRFKGKIGAWGHIQIVFETLEKWHQKKNLREELSFEDFFLEISHLTKMDSIVFSQFLEEAQQSLFSEFQRQKYLEENFDEDITPFFRNEFLSTGFTFTRASQNIAQ